MNKLATMMAGALLAALLAAPVRAADSPPDAWITTKAKIAVLTSVGVPGTRVHVDTVRGKVTLHGKVASADDKAKAEHAVAALDGVQDVRNLLQVVPAKEAEAVSASDDKIEKRLGEALKKESLLRGSGIRVRSVNKGMVLLSG